jgi:large subunit ribosomal protein L9
MAHVKVVLREDVQHLGTAGELVRVRAGYARIYLLPRGMVALATAGSIRQVEEQKKQAIARAAKLKASASALATQLGGLTIEIARQAGEGDRLYGSVTSKDVADAIKQKGYDLDKKSLVMPDAIKELGEHTVRARLGSGVEAQFKLVVKKSS